MANTSEFDPMALWQQLVGQWERQVNDLSAKISGSEEFAGPMNQANKLTLSARKSMDAAMERMVQTMQLASNAQMLEVIERLDRIEQQLATVAAAVAPQKQAPAVPIPEPRRTKRPAATDK